MEERFKRFENLLHRRGFCRDSVLQAGSLLALSAVSPGSALGQEQRSNSQRAASTRSISRQFAQWVVGLRYEDLPPAVVDRAKGVTIHTLASALIGSQLP